MILSTFFALCAALTATVSANDLATSLWHPDAGAMDAGFAYAGAGALASVGPDHAGTWAVASGGWGITGRLAVSGTALVATNSSLVAGGVRYNLFNGPWFRAAPVVFCATWTESASSPTTAGLGAGMAFEGGFPRVRFDTFLSALLVRTGEGSAGEGSVGETNGTPAERLPGFGLYDLGLTVRIGSDHAHRVRGAVNGQTVGVTYQYVGDRWFMEGSGQAGLGRVSTGRVSGSVRGGLVF